MPSRSHRRRSHHYPVARPIGVDWELVAGSPAAAPLDLGIVSCLCVTRGRYQHVERMLRCFQAQTYANRELVVVHQGLEDAARELLDTAPRVRAVALPAVPKHPLGVLRNRSIASASGAYVCCWDDDDWHSPRRIELQLQALASSGAEACVLKRWLMLDESSGRAYVSGYRSWEGSLLCRRELSVLEQGYPALARAEDSELVQRLAERHRLCSFDRPELYVYTFHGENTWDAAHFQALFAAAFELAPEDGERLRRTLAPRA